MKRDFRFFEQWARRNGMAPVMRIKDVTVNGAPVGDILVADSGSPIELARTPDGEPAPHRRYYRTAWALDRGDKTWHASWNDYPMDTLLVYTERSKAQMRVKEAVDAATEQLKLLASPSIGLYRGNDRRLN